MDSPSNALTNVLKIDNLSHVPYSIYTPIESESVPLTDRQSDILRDAERSLKADGVPVFLDLENGRLWVFHISGLVAKAPVGEEEGEVLVPPATTAPGKDDRWLQIEHRLVEEWRLEESSNHVFLASSLALRRSTPATATSGPESHSATSTRPKPGVPVTIDLTLDDPAGEAEKLPQEVVVYRNLISAVLAVLSFCLSSREGFTPLNARTLVSPLSLPAIHQYRSEAERNSREEILPSQLITVPEIVAPVILELDVYMTCAGTLVIVPRSEKQEGIRRVGTCGLTPASLRDREVFIAPWGEWGRILEPSEDAPPQRAQEKWKAAVVSYLKDRGMIAHALLDEPKKRTALHDAIEHGKWLTVETFLTGELYRALWPEALLFLRISEGDKREVALALPRNGNPSQPWESVFESQEYSHLAWGKLASLISTLDCGAKTAELDSGAEWWSVPSAVDWGLAWLKGQEERAQRIKDKLEERRKKELAEARLDSRDALAPETLDKGKGKLVPDAAKPGLGGGGNIGAGVYPTPPDAAAAAAAVTSTGGPASTSSTGAAGGPGNGMDHDWNGDPAATDGNTIGGETDLFGEDDMDMLMKVTEDDFDFFDNNDNGFGDGDGDGMGDDGDGDGDGDGNGDGDGDGNGDGNGNGGGSGDGEMDLDVGSINMNDAHMIGADGVIVDLPMETPPQIPKMAENDSAMVPTRQPEGRNKRRPRVPAPPEVKAVQALPENQVRTPPLSPHRAMSLLVPGYSPPTANGTANFTPPASGQPKKTAAAAAAKLESSPSATLARRRMSMYSPIMFTENVEMADQKYAPGGRFFLPENATTDHAGNDEDVTKIGKRQSLKRKRIGPAPSSGPATATPMEVATLPRDDEDEDTDSASDRDDVSSEESDADDTTEDGESQYHTSPDGAMRAPRPFPGWGKKPKWPMEGGEMDIDLPEGFQLRRDLSIGVEGNVDVVPDVAPAPWKSMPTDPTEESLVGVFDHMMLTSNALTLRSLSGDAEFLEVASVLAGQLAGWMHASWRGKNETLGDDEEDEESCLIRRRCGRDQSLVEDAVRTLFKESTVRCSLAGYASIADSIQEPVPIPPPPPLGHFGGGGGGMRPNLSQRRNKEPERPSAKSWDIFHVPPPHVRLQRGDNTLEMLPPALYFWETFSLAPVSGAKNVISFCLHPASGALEEGADFLLDRVSSSYEAGRFGLHVRAEVEGVTDNGLVPVEMPDDAPRDYEYGMKSLLSHLESFGSVIAHGVADEGANVVVYVVNPFEHPSALVDISTGFVRMRRLYNTCIATLPEAKPNHLVLQVVPANFVAHKLGGVMRVGVVHHLAVEVYSRCIPTDGGTDYEEARRAASPAIQLARPIPKSIEFQITPSPSPALLKENQLLHVAYSQSLDERWVAVAWSDNTGALQRTGIINLGRQGTNVLRPFRDVVDEIWKTTAELIKYPAVRWRLCITKVCSGATMPDDEREAWRALVATHERVSASYLLSADISSPLRVLENLPELRMENFWPQASLYSTPPAPTPTGSTPIVSPDATATTPGGGGFSEPAAELDADAELVDSADESWGVVVGHTVPREPGKRQHRPTGLLLRRDGAAAGWRVVVSLAVVEGGGVEVVREVVEVWRGLGVLGSFLDGTRGLPRMFRWCAGAEKVARVM